MSKLVEETKTITLNSTKLEHDGQICVTVPSKISNTYGLSHRYIQSKYSETIEGTCKQALKNIDNDIEIYEKRKLALKDDIASIESKQETRRELISEIKRFLGKE